MSEKSIPFSNAHQGGLRLKSEGSWRKGIADRQEASLEDVSASKSATQASSSTRSLPKLTSSKSSFPLADLKSASISSKDISTTWSTTASTSGRCTSNAEIELKNHIRENLLLTQEIMDLKMRLATALTHVDAEKHTNRLQSEQISNLCEENEELKKELDEAHLQTIDMKKKELEAFLREVATPADQSKDMCPGTDSPEFRDNKQGWLRRVSNGLMRSTSSSALPATARQASQRSVLENSTSRLLLFKSDLASEELASPKNRTSFLSSLSSFAEEPCTDIAGHHQKNDDWLDLDAAVVLNADRLDHNIFTARRA